MLSDDAVSSVKFVHGIKVLMAKNYLDNLSEETRKGMHEKARQGLWPSRAPFGYANVARSDGKRVIEPDPQAAPLIAKLFELYATDEYPITGLTDKARRLGLVYRQSGRPLPRTQSHVMLRNPVYIGEFDWKGVRYRGSHEPLVSRTLWETVQNLLGRRAPRHRVRQRHEFAFSRLVRCGRCRDEGRRFLLVAERQKRRYVYYRCEECKRRRRAEFVREERLVEAFGEALAALPTGATTLEAARKALGRNEPVTHDLGETNLRAEHTSLQARIDTAHDDRVAGRIDAAYFDRRAAEWRARTREIDAALARLPDAVVSTDSDAALELAEVVSIFGETDDPLLRRRLIASLHSNSFWRDRALHVERRQPADVLEESGDAQRRTGPESGPCPV